MKPSRRPAPAVAGIAVLVAVLASASCALLEPRRLEVVVSEPGLASTELSMGRITLQPQQLFSGMGDSLEEIFIAAAARHGLAVRPSERRGPSDLRVSALVHQKAYSRRFEERFSITLVLTVKKEAATVAQLVYTRDSAVPLDSFALFYDILDEALPALASRLAPPKP